MTVDMAKDGTIVLTIDSETLSLNEPGSIRLLMRIKWNGNTEHLSLAPPQKGYGVII